MALMFINTAQELCRPRMGKVARTIQGLHKACWPSLKWGSSNMVVLCRLPCCRHIMCITCDDALSCCERDCAKRAPVLPHRLEKPSLNSLKLQTTGTIIKILVAHCNRRPLGVLLHPSSTQCALLALRICSSSS